VTQVSERSNVRDDERHAKLIVGSYLPQRDAPVLQRQSAAVSVVTHLHQLVLQRVVRDVVADSRREVEALPRLRSVPDQRPNLIRLRWQYEGIRIQAKIGHGEEKFLVRLDLRQRPDGRQLSRRPALRVIFQNLFEIERPARRQFEIADQRRPVPRPIRKRERRNFIQRLEHVSHARNQPYGKRRIEKVLLAQFPRNQLLRLVVAFLHP